MLEMDALYRQILIFVTVMAIGFFGTKAKGFNRETQKAAAALTIYCGIPAVVLTAVLNAGRGLIISQLRITAVMLVLMGVLFVLGIIIGKLAGLKGTRYELQKALTVFSNTGYMGYPLVEAIFGTAGMVPIIIISIVDNLCLWSFGSYFITGGKYGGRFGLKRLLNPIFIVLIVSLLLAFAGLKPRGFVFEALAGVGGITKYLCMLWLGMELAQSKFLPVFRHVALYIHIVLKMMVMPILVYYVLSVFNILEGTALFTVTLVMALPCMATVGVLAQDTPEQESASSMILGTMLFSLITIPAVFFIIEHLLL